MCVPGGVCVFTSLSSERLINPSVCVCVCECVSVHAWVGGVHECLLYRVCVRWSPNFACVRLCTDTTRVCVCSHLSH